jgi:hypothetical protein
MDLSHAVHFEVGKTYDRSRDIHAAFVGQQQGGMRLQPKGRSSFCSMGNLANSMVTEMVGARTACFSIPVRAKPAICSSEPEIMPSVTTLRMVRTSSFFQSLGKGKGYRFVGQFICTSWEKIDRRRT